MANDAIRWCKSSFSGGDGGEECVELADSSGRILIRESDHPDIILNASCDTLLTFVLSIKGLHYVSVASMG